jgi:hypothetical protein
MLHWGLSYILNLLAHVSCMPLLRASSIIASLVTNISILTCELSLHNCCKFALSASGFHHGMFTYVHVVFKKLHIIPLWCFLCFLWSTLICSLPLNQLFGSYVGIGFNTGCVDALHAWMTHLQRKKLHNFRMIQLVSGFHFSPERSESFPYFFSFVLFSHLICEWGYEGPDILFSSIVFIKFFSLTKNKFPWLEFKSW